MFKIEVEQQRTVDRKVTFKQLGQKDKGKCLLTYKVVDTEDAAELIASHDKALGLKASDGNEVKLEDLPDTAVALAKWMCDTLPGKYLLKWDIAVGESEVSEITPENLAAVLSDGLRFWAIHDDFMDLITEISNGKPKSVAEQERKNLLKSVGSSRLLA